MNSYQDKTVCVVDGGYCVELARRLSRDFGKVYYHSPWVTAIPGLSASSPGAGFKEIERVNYLHSIIDEVDLFVFPWLFFWDLQEDLEKRGKRVWGARKGEFLELDRSFFKQRIENIGLPSNGWQQVTGITALEELLKDHDDVWVKTAPHVRLEGETWHSDNYDLSKAKLVELRHEWGELAESVKFIVEEAIDGIEDGADTYTIDGKVPDHAFEGLEIKDCGTVVAYKPWEAISNPVRTSMEALLPYLKGCRSRTMFGSEIRVAKSGKGYFTDPTMRCSIPPSGVIWEMLKNLSDILWNGADGKLVQPECDFLFGIECSIFKTFTGSQTFEIDPGLASKVKLYYPSARDGKLFVPPQWVRPGEPMGAVVGMGNTIEEAVKDVKQSADGFKAFQDHTRLDSIADAFSQIEAGKRRGINFTDADVPGAEELEKLLA